MTFCNRHKFFFDCRHRQGIWPPSFCCWQSPSQRGNSNNRLTKHKATEMGNGPGTRGCGTHRETGAATQCHTEEEEFTKRPRQLQKVTLVTCAIDYETQAGLPPVTSTCVHEGRTPPGVPHLTDVSAQEGRPLGCEESDNCIISISGPSRSQSNTPLVVWPCCLHAHHTNPRVNPTACRLFRLRCAHAIVFCGNLLRIRYK